MTRIVKRGVHVQELGFHDVFPVIFRLKFVDGQALILYDSRIIQVVTYSWSFCTTAFSFREQAIELQ